MPGPRSRSSSRTGTTISTCAVRLCANGDPSGLTRHSSDLMPLKLPGHPGPALRCAYARAMNNGESIIWLNFLPYKGQDPSGSWKRAAGAGPGCREVADRARLGRGVERSCAGHGWAAQGLVGRQTVSSRGRVITKLVRPGRLATLTLPP